MLLSNLDLLATAPGGVARLRELILTLAVQGKLVPQDPADEPASVLLQKIRAEKDRLMAEGKIRRSRWRRLRTRKSRLRCRWGGSGFGSEKSPITGRRRRLKNFSPTLGFWTWKT